MSKNNDFRIKNSKLLLVEGRDELRVFTKIINILAVLDIQVIQYEGKTKFASFLMNVLIKDPRFRELTSIGILRDADGDAKNAFDSVCNGLKECGLAIPNKENEKTIDNPNISILILPGNGQTGSLEDVFINSVKEDQVYACVEEYFKCLDTKQAGVRKNVGKAKVHVYLASNLDDPDKRLGESVEAEFWDFTKKSFSHVIEFIKLL